MRLGPVLLGLLAVPAMSSAQPARALAEAMEMFADKVVRSEAYQPDGIDIRRGVVLDLKADALANGTCRAQRVFLFHKRGAPESLDHVEVQNRYQAADWAPRYDGPPGACGDPREGRWTVARDDREFIVALPAIGQVYRLTTAGRPASAYPFKFVCVDHGKPCADPAARLKDAFALGVDEVGVDQTGRGGSVIWARRSAYGQAPHWAMRIESVSGAISTVTLDFTIPPIS